MNKATSASWSARTQTAAMIWLTAAVGLTAGSGPWALATAATAIHLIVAFVYTPLVRLLVRLLATLAYSLTSFRVSYRDGLGVPATYSLRRPRRGTSCPCSGRPAGRRPRDRGRVDGRRR